MLLLRKTKLRFGRTRITGRRRPGFDTSFSHTPRERALSPRRRGGLRNGGNVFSLLLVFSCFTLASFVPRTQSDISPLRVNE